MKNKVNKFGLTEKKLVVEFGGKKYNIEVVKNSYSDYEFEYILEDGFVSIFCSLDDTNHGRELVVYQPYITLFDDRENYEVLINTIEREIINENKKCGKENKVSLCFFRDSNYVSEVYLKEKYKDVAEDYVNSVGANPFDQVVVSSEYIVSEAEIISETCSKKEQEEDKLE